jgi:hypothetical protein
LGDTHLLGRHSLLLQGNGRTKETQYQFYAT